MAKKKAATGKKTAAQKNDTQPLVGKEGLNNLKDFSEVTLSRHLLSQRNSKKRQMHRERD